MRLLLTRPQAEASAEKLRGRGHDVVIMPLMAFEPVPWERGGAAPDAIMLTSPQAARAAGVAWPVPAYAVGGATAEAARGAGFADVRDGGGTVQALVDRAAADGVTQMLHLAGADRTAFVVPAGLRIDTVIVYRARLLPMEALPESDLVMLYSARTAAHFAAECDRLGLPRAGLALAVLSPAIALAAGPGWHHVITAAAPHEEALLAAIDAACDSSPGKM
jgi:uroporphyrinogen-III synthase